MTTPRQNPGDGSIYPREMISEEFTPGEQIYHPIYGKGIVLPNDPIEYVNVQFESTGKPMKLVIAYAKITRIDKA